MEPPMQKLLGLACFRGEGPYDEPEESLCERRLHRLPGSAHYLLTQLCAVLRPQNDTVIYLDTFLANWALKIGLSKTCWPFKHQVFLSIMEELPSPSPKIHQCNIKLRYDYI